MTDLNSCKVFVVDDNVMCQIVYKKHLANLGFANVSVFANGVDCMKNMHLSPDIILLDFDVEPGNGIEILKEIKEQYPQTHIIMISAQQDIQVVIEAMRYGVSGYIMKDEKQLAMVQYEIDKILNHKGFNSQLPTARVTNNQQVYITNL